MEVDAVMGLSHAGPSVPIGHHGACNYVLADHLSRTSSCYLSSRLPQHPFVCFITLP